MMIENDKEKSLNDATRQRCRMTSAANPLKNQRKWVVQGTHLSR